MKTQKTKKYEIEVSNLSTVALRVACKRKASDDVSQRPSKIIRSTVQSSGIVPSVDQVTSQDVVNCRAAMYRERRKKYVTRFSSARLPFPSGTELVATNPGAGPL